MTQNKRARSQQRLIAPNTSEEVTPSSAYSHFNKALPKKKTDLNKLTSQLCSEFGKPNDPTSVSNIHLNVYRQVYEMGMRKNVDILPEVLCPNCNELHDIECPHCGKKHNIDILDSTKEKTSAACLALLMNKFFPNKAPVAQEFDQVMFVEKITEYVSKVIAALTPELKQTYTEMWIKVVGELESDA